LVVTFTNASAEDMKKRLIDSLLLLPADEFVLNQIENISTSDISNLHSFCSRLITTYFYEIGIDPSYHIVDETESKFLKEKAISRLFEIKENEYNEDFFMLFDMFQKKRKTSELKEIIFKFNNFLNSNVDSKTWFDEKLKLSYDENLETNDCAKLIKNYVCNSILELQEEIGEFIKFCQSVGFNKYANYFIDLYEKIKCNNISNLTYEETEFLKEACFLVSDDFDESGIQSIIKNVINNRINIVFITTDDCNFRCSYCYESHIKKSIDKNTYDDTLKFLNRFEKDELLINWFGGEPTLRMNEIHYFMQEVYKLKKFKKITSSIVTNGYLLSEKNFNQLINDHINNFQITLDGLKDEHNKHRFLEGGIGTFDTIIKNLKTRALPLWKAANP